MPRSQEFKLVLTCEQCSIVNIFDFTQDPETLAPKLRKWLTLGTAAQQQGEDPKYFDDMKCLVQWKLQHDEKDRKFLKQQAEYLENIEKIKNANLAVPGMDSSIATPETSSVTLTDSD